jgi:hypothetical protein
MDQRHAEQHLFRDFASRHAFSSATNSSLPITGVLDGIALSLAKVDRGQPRNPWPVTQFLAVVPSPIPGGLVAYKPNFRWRFKGPRKIADSLGSSGLIGFVHHDAVDDAELDKKLVIFADDVTLARKILKTPNVKDAILSTLAAAGHLRIQESRVAVEISERRRGILHLLTRIDEVESLARCATNLARALSEAATLHPR